MDYHEISDRAERVAALSLLTLIYRSIPPQKPSCSQFCRECIDAARETLKEHDLCVGAIVRSQGKAILLEAYINWFVVRTTHVQINANSVDQEHLPIPIHPIYRTVLPHDRNI